MTYPPEVLKKIIETFVDESVDENIALQSQGGITTFANRLIFEIESYLVQLRNEHGVNNRMDTSIVSENILKEFNNISALAAFRSVDYQYNFLYHLAQEFKTDLDLFQLVDSFIIKFKDEFKLADIVITNSGATRCKTNIRFALNGLRDLGLVLSRDPKQKRSWGVSVIGLVALLNVRLNMPEAQRWFVFKKPESLRPFFQGALKPSDKLPTYYDYDPVLVQSLAQFKNEPTHLYVYLSGQRDISLSVSEKELLQRIMQDFVDFTETGLEITENGVKQTKQFSVLSKIFQKKLFSIEENNPVLHSKLYAHFRDIKKSNNN